MKWNNVYTPLHSASGQTTGPFKLIRFKTRYNTVWNDLYPDDPEKAEQLSRLSRELINLGEFIRKQRIPERLICEYLKLSQEELKLQFKIDTYADMNYDDACNQLLILSDKIIGMISIDA